jgi:sarcosine oxidase subunit alpha
VTSAYFSASCEEPIALALLENGRARHGEPLRATADQGEVEVCVVPPIFVDPEGKRLAC